MKNIKNIFLGVTLIMLVVGLSPVFAQSAIQDYEKLLAEADNALLANRYEDAIAALQKARKINPGDPTVDVASAFASFYLNRPKEAISYLESALNSKNIDDDFVFCLALLYDSVGLKEKARLETENYINKCQARRDVVGIFKGRLLLKKITGR